MNHPTPWRLVIPDNGWPKVVDADGLFVFGVANNEARFVGGLVRLDVAKQIIEAINK